MAMLNPALAAIGIGVVPFFGNHTVTYSGPYAPFTRMFDNLSPQQKNNIKVFNLTLLADIVQEPNLCCMIMNMVAAGFCIFPAFFICCPFFVKASAGVSVADPRFYETLGATFAQCPNLQNIHITVNDAIFNASKAHALQQGFMRCPKLINFLFRNQSGAQNIEECGYDDFDKCFPQLRSSTHTMYTLQWADKLTTFTNITVPTMGGYGNTSMGFGGYPPAPKAFF